MSAEQTPLMQRLGTAFLQRRAAALPAVKVDDAIHILDAREQAALLDIQRKMILRALVAGGLSGLVAALAELLAHPLEQPGAPLHDNLSYWAVVGGVTVLATLLEIAFLYWDSLRSVHNLARAAGVRLFGGGGGEYGAISPLAATLARAALEMPSPTDNEFDVDPYREVSKLRLLLASLLYKAKITVTSFLIKALLRRAMGRAALRVWLVFVGVPVCALWNAVVAWLVIRQARIRAIGASAASVYLGLIFAEVPAEEHFSDEVAKLLWAAVASCVVRSHELHPNHLALLYELQKRVPRPQADISDSAAFVQSLSQHSDRDRTLALSLLAVAAVLDGRLARDERKLLREAFASSDRTLVLDQIETLRSRFVAGQEVDTKLLRAVAGA